jgi:hypothetical protein
MLLLSSFTAESEWNLPASVPPGLAGFEAGFALIGRDGSGKLGLSNETVLAFR